MEKKDYFVVTRIHREDLEAIGYDTSNVSDETMQQIAKEMHEAYMNDAFWYSLGASAQSHNIPTSVS